MKAKHLYLLIFSFLLIISCSKEELPSNGNNNNNNNGNTTTTKSSAKDITKFSFAALSPAVDATIDATTKTITATVPASTDITKLVPTITISDKATVSPASGVATDFSKEVSYTVTAEDASTQVWKVNVAKELPPVQNDMVFVANNFGVYKLFALNAETGSKIWEVNIDNIPTGHFSTSPTYYNGTLYLPSTGKLYAFDAKTGTKKWEYLAVTSYICYGVWNSPMVSDGIVYYGDGGSAVNKSTFYAIDADSGKLIWKYEISGDKSNGVFASPTVADGLVYFSSRNGFLYALDAKTGTKKWEYYTGIAYDTSSPVVSNGLIYAGNTSFFALDAKTGLKKWEYKGEYALGTYIENFFTAPTIINGSVYTSNNSNDPNLYKSKLLALNTSNGSINWAFELTDGRTTGINFDNENLYTSAYTATNYRITAFDLQTKVKKWEIVSFKLPLRSSTVANKVLFQPSNDKKLYCIDGKTGKIKWEHLSSGEVSNCIVLDKNGKVFYSPESGMLQ